MGTSFDHYLVLNKVSFEANKANQFVEELDSEKLDHYQEALIKRNELGSTELDPEDEASVAKRENLKFKTMAQYKVLKKGDLQTADRIRANEINLGLAKSFALEEPSIEAMEELI